ncbi:hypothetical protein HHI36_009018 [Cryptolaemus montrouzieri]|uniref:Uncharacterized protein n=1 Tax=Cryptolaemus montrouzieri TaxID=559131 RepID=A0ABD2MU89_9CUCU
MNEKIELLETNIKTELEKNKVEFEERLKIDEDKIIKLESRKQQLRKDLNIVAEKQKKNNLIINGLDIGERSPSDAARKILSFNQIKVESCDISDAYSLGKGNEKPIIKEFISYSKKIEDLKNFAKLKPTGVFLSNDLIPEDERVQQKILVGRIREERRLGHTCKLQDLNLVIDEKFYTLEQLEERRKNESGISGAVNDSSKEVVNKIEDRNKPATRSNSNRRQR